MNVSRAVTCTHEFVIRDTQNYNLKMVLCKYGKKKLFICNFRGNGYWSILFKTFFFFFFFFEGLYFQDCIAKCLY